MAQAKGATDPVRRRDDAEVEPSATLASFHECVGRGGREAQLGGTKGMAGPPCTPGGTPFMYERRRSCTAASTRVDSSF